MAKFKTHTIEEHTQALADFLPGGKLYESKNLTEKKLRKLLIGLATESLRIEENIKLVSEDYDIRKTVFLIEEWERMFGIPNECIPIAPTLEERRNNILLRLNSNGTVTVEQFTQLAHILGFLDVIIFPLQDVAFPPYDVPFIPTSAPSSRFIWVVKGTNVVLGVPPYNVPFTPLGGLQSVLQCIFNKLKPANTSIIFINSN